MLGARIETGEASYCVSTTIYDVSEDTHVRQYGLNGFYVYLSTYNMWSNEYSSIPPLHAPRVQIFIIFSLDQRSICPRNPISNKA